MNLADLIPFVEAAKLADITPRYLRRLVASGREDIPQPLRFGQRAAWFRESQFRTWAASWQRRERRVKKKARVAGAALD